eukprot:TRINITY_DN43280_c0_g1_i1.p1 TRINITY_DN43280_c0_g1~~TRINITY_DN43280_c0_g1_i1.p1  ORF type:complete len:287 (-),score=18.11 TRINITY_DN43280_c0_g1_i1:646-1506(-)
MTTSSLTHEFSRYLPEPPLLAAGALGGPFVISALTPLRNAMSNGAQDQAATLRQLYSKAFGLRSGAASVGPRLRVAYTGALVSAGPACPQWTMIGPAFHVVNAHLPTTVALLGIAWFETIVTYGSQSRNVQMSYNVQKVNPSIPLIAAYRPWGPGACFFMIRNFCGMSGIRLLSPLGQQVLEPLLPSGSREMVSDFMASMLTCVVSGPLNVCWSYTVTTPALWTVGFCDRSKAILQFLGRHYLNDSGRGGLTPLVKRDLAARCIYISCCFTLFSGIERFCVAYWPK